ncbi:MAG: hypothetical protein S4CHLAM45_00490 [Chlamydiales bacterium]|nr:hypothetical protein [Chlamydiales bacterium]MCH9619371.1 hypothetical protein [Chlamydiales bacterium]MCH9622175.1 hypothetical protein [Chlamydiales bacterium]
MPRTTLGKPFNCEPHPTKSASLFNRLCRVVGARGVETAAASYERPDTELVKADKE